MWALKKKKKKNQDTQDEKAFPHFRKIFVIFAERLNKHWLIKTCLIACPIIWTQIVLKHFSTSLGLYNESTKQYSWIATLLSIIIYGFSILVTFLTALKTERDMKRQKNIEAIEDEYNVKIKARDSMIAMLKKMLSEEKGTEIKRVGYLLQAIKRGDRLTPEVGDFIEQAYSPINHMKSIMESLKNCILQVYSSQNQDIEDTLTAADLYISMAMKTPLDDWDWVYHEEIDGCASDLKSLRENEKSTFYAVLNGITEEHKTYKFYNDKYLGINGNPELKIQGGHYVPDPKDYESTIDGRIVGSILCWKLDLSLGNINGKDSIIEAVISISTYGHKLFDENDTATLQRLYKVMFKENIINQFENEIRIDMALEYIYSICKSKKS